MDHFYSDLEEGEILDDSPPSPDLNINRRKELPQRYIVKGNKTPLHKHKRGCRHSTRHHTKKLPNTKKKPVRKKNSPKWHHKPPNTNEKHKIVSRYDSSNKSKHTLPKCFSENSLIAEMKDSLKSISPLKKLRTNFSNSRSQKIPFPKQNSKTSKSDFATSEISNTKILQNVVENSVASNESTNSVYVEEKTDSIEDLSKNSDDASSVIELSICDSKPEPPLIDLSRSPDPDDTSSTIELIDVKIEDNTISNKSATIKEEESEDEEELRRIALATCAKRKALRESTNTIQNVNYTCNAPVPDLTCVNDVPISHQKVNNLPTMDNYEVVDMEVDEDMQDSLENQQVSLINQQQKSAENLFVIDRNPSNDFLKNKNTFSETQAVTNSDDEDFEVNLLRAQLLTNMNRKKFLQEHSDQDSKVIVHKKPVPRTPVVPQRVNNYQKLNLMFSHKRLKSAKHFLRRRSVNKLININNSSNNNNNETKKVLPLPVQISKPPERLIITVNGESSDESDNSDQETNTVSENPVDSIVALISDCRQKSESSVESKEKEIVPKAVSCLSKAQQEEYNALMKILAKKKKSLPVQENVSAKNGSVHSPLEDLKKLEKKLTTLQNTQKTKKDSIALLSEEVNSKRHHYMKAKLTAQHLKEQWVAAEKVRKAKLLDWSKTCDNFKLMKKSVSDLEKKINEVQNLCSKLGSSVHGQTYKLPLLLTGNEQS